MDDYVELLKDIVESIKDQAGYILDKDANSKDFDFKYEFGLLFGLAESLETIKRHSITKGLDISHIGFYNFSSYDLLSYRPKNWVEK